jgi:hypothetical protein
VSYLTSYSTEIEFAWEAIEHGFAQLPVPLDGLGLRWLAHIGGPEPRGPLAHRRYFRQPVAPPLIFLPLWFAESLNTEGETITPKALAAVLQATMWGYFAIRLQDDILDERDPVRAYALLANVCRLRMQQALRRAVQPGPSLQATLDGAWLDFTRCTLAEYHQVRGADPYTRASFLGHCDKVAFAAISVAPLLSAKN